MINDDAALELISNAAKERLKYLIEQVKLVALHRIDISMKVKFDSSSFQNRIRSSFRMIQPINKQVMSKDKSDFLKIWIKLKNKKKIN